jgi:hypothetical protein
MPSGLPAAILSAMAVCSLIVDDNPHFLASARDPLSAKAIKDVLG